LISGWLLGVVFANKNFHPPESHSISFKVGDQISQSSEPLSCYQLQISCLRKLHKEESKGARPLFTLSYLIIYVSFKLRKIREEIAHQLIYLISEEKLAAQSACLMPPGLLL